MSWKLAAKVLCVDSDWQQIFQTDSVGASLFMQKWILAPVPYMQNQAGAALLLNGMKKKP